MPRIHLPNTTHHVMIRGNNRQRIFFDEDDFNFFLEILLESIEKFDHKILAYCLMTNHVHIIIHVNNISLSNVMKNINYRYARRLNKKKNRIGHLFQGRYRSLAIQNETYLINLCRYIHFNPVAAKIVSHPRHYRWSSHQDYTSKEKSMFIASDIVIDIIIKKTGLKYNDFINSAIDRENWKPSLFLSDSGQIVVDDTLIENTTNSLELFFSRKNYLSKDAIDSIVCKNLKINPSVLYGKSSNHEITKNRALLIHCLLRHSDISLSSAAKLFQKSQGTISRQVGKVKLSFRKCFSDAVLEKIEKEIQQVKAKGLIQ